MRSNTYQSSGSHRDRHHHGSYTKNPRYTSYAAARPYSSSSSRPAQHQHSHRSAHSAHNMHSSYGSTHSNRSSNHNHSPRRHSSHSSLHSMNNSRNTHNLSSHSNRNRNSHHNNSTSHRPHSNPRSRNIRHSVHSAHRSSNRNTVHSNNKSPQKSPRNKSPQRISRSRNIRNINTSHSHTHRSIPIVDLIEPTSTKHDNSNNNKGETDKGIKSTETKQHCIQTVDILESTMNQLSFASAGYKHDYCSKINMSLEAAKCDTDRLKFHLNPNKVREWSGDKTETEKTHCVRDHMLFCLKLINKLMAMDEAIDFIFAPNSCTTNPEFFAAFEGFDKEKNGKNMCLEWVQNLLYSDAYETVDDFAADVRLIFKNIYNVFGYEHEWSKNARNVQNIFEQELVCISREISNANDIFTQNGNPSSDPQQIKCLNLDTNKKEIEHCVELLQVQRKREKEVAKYQHVNKSKITNGGEHKSNAKEKEKEEILTKKQQRTKYLENIDRSKRKRASKQKLKSRSKPIQQMEVEHSVECEEGEIQRIEPLDESKLDETDVWFEFIGQYPAYAVDIKRVIMICEGFTDEIQFKKYKEKLASIGSDLSLNIKNKSASIQCKIYDILQAAKNRITGNNPLLLSVLQDLTEKKSKQRNMKKRVRNKKVLDPYSNEAMEEKRKIKEMEQAKVKQMQQAQQLKACKQKIEMEIDEDSEGSFDDNLYFDHEMMDITNAQTANNVYRNNDKMAKANTIGQELPSNGGYLPIRPNNVDDELFDHHHEQMEYKSNSPSRAKVELIEEVEEDDNSQWDKFKYTKQQQADDEEEIDF